MENAVLIDPAGRNNQAVKKTHQDTDWKTGLFLNKDLGGNGCFYLICQVSLFSTDILTKEKMPELTFMKNAGYLTILKLVESFPGVFEPYIYLYLFSLIF